MKKYNYESDRQDYQTPQEILDIIFQELNMIGQYKEKFDCDVCCNCENIPAKIHYFEGVVDGLKVDWHELNYCNPPYKDCAKWVVKAYNEMLKGNTTIMLIPARTETKYWQDYILYDGYAVKFGVLVKFLKKGYQFINPINNKPMGVFKNPLAIVVFDGYRTYRRISEIT